MFDGRGVSEKVVEGGRERGGLRHLFLPVILSRGGYFGPEVFILNGLGLDLALNSYGKVLISDTLWIKVSGMKTLRGWGQWIVLSAS